MSDRKTLNVSLPSEQERFVRTQVQAGRYRTASEVVRDGLRLLEVAEHRRLLEKWLYEGLSPEEEASVPADLLAGARAHIRKLIEKGLDDVAAGRTVDGPPAMEGLRERLEAKRTT